MASKDKGDSVKVGWRDDGDWSKLRKEVDRGDSILLVWNVVDVRQVAKEKGVKLTRDECREVLALCENNHDATMGMNWDDILLHMEAVIERRK